MVTDPRTMRAEESAANIQRSKVASQRRPCSDGPDIRGLSHPHGSRKSRCTAGPEPVGCENDKDQDQTKTGLDVSSPTVTITSTPHITCSSPSPFSKTPPSLLVSQGPCWTGECVTLALGCPALIHSHAHNPTYTPMQTPSLLPARTPGALFSILGGLSRLSCLLSQVSEQWDQTN
jgi:hypothetical protein